MFVLEIMHIHTTLDILQRFNGVCVLKWTYTPHAHTVKHTHPYLCPAPLDLGDESGGEGYELSLRQQDLLVQVPQVSTLALQFGVSLLVHLLLEWYELLMSVSRREKCKRNAWQNILTYMTLVHTYSRAYTHTYTINTPYNPLTSSCSK